MPRRDRWSLGASEDGVVFAREVFDQDLILVQGELCAAPGEAGVFTGRVVGEGVSVPVREFVVGSARRQAQDEAIVLDSDFERSKVLV